MQTHDGEKRLAPVLVAALLVGVATPAAAQGWIDPLPRVTDWGVTRLSTDVTVRVEGRVAEVVVEEWFENRGRGLAEGDYLYPLPGEAVFTSFSLYQGDRELRGEAMDAEQARGIYEEIVRRKRDPALIELAGHGLVRARVFPIEPGQRRRVTLRYTQVLERAGEAVQVRYAAAHRDSAPVTFTLLADSVYGDPFSPTHPLDVERRDGRLRVTPAGELTGELSVFLPVGDDVGMTLAAHRPAGEDGYFMLTLSPGRVERSRSPRDVTAVVDVSGSMSGAKLEQTRAALHQLLGSLVEDDRFRLVAFSSRVQASSDGWSGTGAGALRDARRWVDALEANGGTNIAGALDEALRLDSPAGRLPIVVFLTDGLPTVGEQNPERIAASAEAGRGRTRVFAFGVGYDVNTYLLDRLGEAGRGGTAYVDPREDVERALSSLVTRISHPVLTDLELAGAPVRLTELYPGELPDLFAGEELVVFGRYEGGGEGGEGAIRLRGRRGGRVERFAARAAFPRQADANGYIPRLWASRKLGELTRQIRLNGPDPELVEEVRRTALRYGLVSEYTSYLVQEPMEQLA
ncbi:MAG: VIT domain-containing protein, partial [Gemmatimonadota bacterium]